MKTEAGNRLGTEKIGKLMLELALPSVLAQIVNVLYNIAEKERPSASVAPHDPPACVDALSA